MSGYLLSMIGVVILASILNGILPEGKMTATIRGITKLACVFVIVAPIYHLVLAYTTPKNIPDNFQNFGIETDGSFIQYYSEMRIENLENELTELVLDKYKQPCDVRLSWEISNEDLNLIRIKQIDISFSNNLSKETGEIIADFLQNEYGCEVKIASF